MFYNYTKEDIEMKWDGKPYTFKAGQVYDKTIISDDGVSNVFLSDAVCSVFAHHLANKVLSTPELRRNFSYDSAGNPIPNDIAQMRTDNFANVEILKQRAITPPSIRVEVPDTLKSVLAASSEVSEAITEVATEADAATATPVEVSSEPKKKLGRPPKSVKEEATLE